MRSRPAHRGHEVYEEFQTAASTCDVATADVSEAERAAARAEEVALSVFEEAMMPYVARVEEVCEQ